jgi:Fanconi anemia group M protein
VRFVGQASKGTDTGLNQREQKEIIDKFRAGDYNVLVSTSIAEEGLDIPATDLVVFFEPVPSEIRTIQRRGRTGRKQAGRVIVLVTRDTRDEAYLWTSRKKEMQMRRELDALRRKLRMRKGVQDEHPRAEKTLTRENIEEMMAPPTGKEERALRASETKGQRSLGQFKKPERGGAAPVTVSDRVAGSGLARELEGMGFLLEPATSRTRMS